MSIADYLDLHGAGTLLRRVIGRAYLAEYGAGIDELSAISFLRFVHHDQRSKQAPFGVHGGEHVRVLEGNDRITTASAAAARRGGRCCGGPHMANTASTGIEYRPFNFCRVAMMLSAFWYSGTSATAMAVPTKDETARLRILA